MLVAFMVKFWTEKSLILAGNCTPKCPSGVVCPCLNRKSNKLLKSRVPAPKEEVHVQGVSHHCSKVFIRHYIGKTFFPDFLSFLFGAWQIDTSRYPAVYSFFRLSSLTRFTTHMFGFFCVVKQGYQFWTWRFRLRVCGVVYCSHSVTRTWSRNDCISRPYVHTMRLLLHPWHWLFATGVKYFSPKTLLTELQNGQFENKIDVSFRRYLSFLIDV